MLAVLALWPLILASAPPDVDPCMMAGIVFVESWGDPRAVNEYDNRFGLGQVSLAVAHEVMPEWGHLPDDWVEFRLLQAHYNLTVVGRYLQRLQNHYRVPVPEAYYTGPVAWKRGERAQWYVRLVEMDQRKLRCSR